ncbi:MAG TPA: hypothetical protein VGC37_01125 [Friedmanniella sp.]
MSEPETLTVEPRAADRRLLVVLVVGALLVALVLGGLAAVDRFRGGGSSPTALAERLVTALDRKDLGALVRLVEPDERAALLRLTGSWSSRLDELGLPQPVGGGPRVTGAAALDGLDVDLTGASPRVAGQSGDVAVIDLGNVALRVRSDPDAAHGLLRTWFAYHHLQGPQDVTYRGTSLPRVGALPRLVSVERSGRWYLSVLATLAGPGLADAGLPAVRSSRATSSPTAQAAVETTLRALLDGRSPTDVSALAGTLDASGSDLAQLWSAELATSGLDTSTTRLTTLTTTDGGVDGNRAVVRIGALRVGSGSGFDLAGACVTTRGERTCLRPSGYRYAGGLGSLGGLELLGRDGAFALTAVHQADGWRTSLPESLTDALTGYADGLSREQVLMVLGQERLDAPSGVLEPDAAEEVAFTSAGYALRTVPIQRPGLYRVDASPAGANRASLYGPDGQPSLEPFFPNDSVYRLTPGDHTLIVWADDAFTRTLDRVGGAPYVQRVEVREVR